MKYFFILGRNPELSRAELYCYLQSRNINLSEFYFQDNIIILQTNKEIDSLNIEHFGGLISFGKLKEFPTNKDFQQFLSENEFVEMDKFTYCVYGNTDSFVFSEKFKKERKKAQIRNFGKKLKLQSGDSAFMPKVDVEIFAFKSDKQILLGLVQQRFDPKNLEFRDMQKPVRRESLAISPRLAKILINLSGAKQGDLLLDPFCGIGGIVQEAVLMEIDSEGLDIDKEAIKAANINLVWFKEKFNFQASYRFICTNSLKAQNKQYDAIVAESSLGEILRKKPAKKQAEKYLEQFKKNIVPLLKHFKNIKKKNAKIAVTFPCFEEAEISKQEIQELTGLSVFSNENIDFPIIEKRHNQFVNRQIWVFY